MSTPDPTPLPERPRALYRAGLARRVMPFAVFGLAIVALTPLFLPDADLDQVLVAIALTAGVIAVALVVPWRRLPRWADGVVAMSAFPIIAVLRDATGGSASILNAMLFLPIFWLALYGSRGELWAALVVLYASLVAPVALIGGDVYPPSEIVRATVWTMLAAVVGFSVQRVVERGWRDQVAAEQTAELRRQANEELRETAELKSQFVAMVSHELRTPLTSIRGFANTILHHYDSLDDEDRRRFAGIIEEQADRLSRLVEDLLTLSRIEAGVATGRGHRVALAPRIEHVVGQFPDAGITVTCEPGLQVLADPDHVEQLLVNLLANALRYGAPPIVVAARANGDSARLTVTDAGPGVEPDFVPLLFERFTQAGRDESTGGTGLGLSIVRGLAQAEGGDAWYERAPEGGACFVVELPLG